MPGDDKERLEGQDQPPETPPETSEAAQQQVREHQNQVVPASVSERFDAFGNRIDSDRNEPQLQTYVSGGERQHAFHLNGLQRLLVPSAARLDVRQREGAEQFTVLNSRGEVMATANIAMSDTRLSVHSTHVVQGEQFVEFEFVHHRDDDDDTDGHDETDVDDDIEDDDTDNDTDDAEDDNDVDNYTDDDSDGDGDADGDANGDGESGVNGEGRRSGHWELCSFVNSGSGPNVEVNRVGDGYELRIDGNVVVDAQTVERAMQLVSTAVGALAETIGIQFSIAQTRERTNTSPETADGETTQDEGVAALARLADRAIAGQSLDADAVRSLVTGAAGNEALSGVLAGSLAAVTQNVGRAVLQEVINQLRNPELTEEQRANLWAVLGGGLSRYATPEMLRAIEPSMLSDGFSDAARAQRTNLSTLVDHALTSSDPAMQEAAVRHLASHGWGALSEENRERAFELAIRLAASTNSETRDAALRAITGGADNPTLALAILNRPGLSSAVRGAVIEGLYRGGAVPSNADLIRHIQQASSNNEIPQSVRDHALVLLLSAGGANRDNSPAAFNALQALVGDPARMQAMVRSALSNDRSRSQVADSLSDLQALAQRNPTLAASMVDALATVMPDVQPRSENPALNLVNRGYETLLSLPGGSERVQQIVTRQLTEPAEAGAPSSSALDALMYTVRAGGEQAQVALRSIQQLVQNETIGAQVRNIVNQRAASSEDAQRLASAVATGADRLPENALQALFDAARTGNLHAVETLRAAAQNDRTREQAIHNLIRLTRPPGDGQETPATVRDAATQALLSLGRNNFSPQLWNALLAGIASNPDLARVATAIAVEREQLPVGPLDSLSTLTTAANSGNERALQVLTAIARQRDNDAAAGAIQSIAQIALGTGALREQAVLALLAVNRAGAPQATAVHNILQQRLSDRTGDQERTVALIAAARLENPTLLENHWESLQLGIAQGSPVAVQTFEQLVRNGGQNGHRALGLLIESARYSDDARNAIQRLLRDTRDANGSPGTWMRELIQYMQDGSSIGRDLLWNLAQVDGARELVLQAMASVYRPQERPNDVNLLPMFLAIARESREMPPERSGPMTTEESRALITALNTELTRRLRADIGEYGNRPASAITNSIIDVMLITASRPGSQGTETARLVAAYANPTNPTVPDSATAFFRRGAQLLDQANLSPLQSSYLANIMEWHLQGIQRERTGGFTPGPLTAERAQSMMAVMNRTHPHVVALSPQFRPYYELIAGGNFGEASRRTAQDRLGSLAFFYPTAMGDDRIPGMLTQLRSTDPAAVERITDVASLNRVVGFANRNSERRIEVVNALLEASARPGLSATARDNLMEAIRAVTAGDASSIRSADVLRAVADRAADNETARRVLLQFAAGMTGSPELHEAARGRLLELAATNPTMRETALRELASVYRSNGTMLPVLAALLSNSREMRDWNQSLRTISDLAASGNRQAMSLLLATAAGGHTDAQRGRDAIAQLARVAGVELPPPAPTPAPEGERAGTPSLHRAQSGGQDAFIDLMRRIGDRAAETGDRRSLEILSQSVTDGNLPPEVRALATTTLNRVVQAGRQNEALDVMLQTWQRDRNPMAFQALATLAAGADRRPEVEQALLEGFRQLSERTPGMSDAEYAMRRSAAASIINDPRYLTPDVMREIARNMSPQLAAALQHAEHIPQEQARQLLDILRETANSAGPSTDRASLALAMSGFARIATTADIVALRRLRDGADVSQVDAIDRAVLNFVTQAENLAVRRDALAIFRGSTAFTLMSDEQKQALTSWANRGFANLEQLRQAIDRTQGADARYPLAVMMRQLGVRADSYESYQNFRRLFPTAAARQGVDHIDWATSQLADRVLAQTTLGGSRTVEGWVLPILTAARVQPGVPRTTDQAFITDVARSLADGQLQPHQEYLVDWQRRMQEQSQSLQLQRMQLVQQIESLRVQISSTPGGVAALYQNLVADRRAYDEAHRRWIDSHANIGLPGPPPPIPDSERFRADEREALASHTAALRRLRELNAQLGEVDAYLAWNNRQQTQAEFFTMMANGQQNEASALAMRLWGQYRLPEHLNGNMNQIWAQLRDRNLTPIPGDLPNLNVSATGMQNAFNVLRGLAVRPDIGRETPADQELHRRSIEALSERSMHVITHQLGLNNLVTLSERFATESQQLLNFFTLAHGRPDERERLVAFIREHGNPLDTFLNSREVRDAVRDANAALVTMRRELATMTPGSIGHQQLSEAINIFQANVRALDPNGPMARDFRDMIQYVREGRLDEPSFLAKLGSVMAHVAVATAVFAASAALVGVTMGAAAPLVVMTATAAVSALGVVGARHATQQALFNLGISNQSSPVFDYLNGRRVIYDPNGASGSRFSGISGSHLVRQLGREVTSEFLANMATAGIGAAFGAGGRALMNRGVLAPRFADLPATTFLGRFREGFNLRTLGIGMAMASPELLGPPGGPAGEGAQEQGVFDFLRHPMFWAGTVLSGYHGFQDGRTIRVAGGGRLNLSTEFNERLGRTMNEPTGRAGQTTADLVRQSLRCLPPEVQQSTARLLLEMPPERRTQLSQILNRMTNPQERAGFLWNLERGGLTGAQQLVQWTHGLNEAQQVEFARRVGAIERPDAVANLFEMLRTTPDDARPAVMQQITRLSPEVLGAALSVTGGSRRRNLIETLSGLNEAEHTALRTAFGNVPHQLRTTFLESVASVREPAARAAILNEVARHPRGATMVETIGRITEPSRRSAVLEAIGALNAERRTALFELIGSTGDPSSRTALLRDIGGMTAPNAGRVLESLASLPAEQARPLSQMLMRMRDRERVTVLDTAAGVNDGAQRLAFLESVNQLGAQQRERLSNFTQMSLTDRVFFAERIGALPREQHADAWTAGSRLNDEQMRTLFGALDGITDNAVRTRALQMVANAGLLETPNLVAAIGRLPAEVRANTLQALAGLPPDLAASFINGLHYTPETLQATVLERFTAMRPIDRLSMVQAINELSSLNRAAGVQTLLQHPDFHRALAAIPEVPARGQALQAFVGLNEAQQRTFMDAFSQINDSGRRRQVLQALGQMGEGEAVAVLNAMRTSSSAHAAEVLEAFARLQPNERALVRNALRGLPEERQTSFLRGLTEMDGPARQRLFEEVGAIADEAQQARRLRDGADPIGAQVQRQNDLAQEIYDLSRTPEARVENRARITELRNQWIDQIMQLPPAERERMLTSMRLAFNRAEGDSFGVFFNRMVAPEIMRGASTTDVRNAMEFAQLLQRRTIDGGLTTEQAYRMSELPASRRGDIERALRDTTTGAPRTEAAWEALIPRLPEVFADLPSPVRTELFGMPEARVNQIADYLGSLGDRARENALASLADPARRPFIEAAVDSFIASRATPPGTSTSPAAPTYSNGWNARNHADARRRLAGQPGAAEALDQLIAMGVPQYMVGQMGPADFMGPHGPAALLTARNNLERQISSGTLPAHLTREQAVRIRESVDAFLRGQGPTEQVARTGAQGGRDAATQMWRDNVQHMQRLLEAIQTAPSDAAGRARAGVLADLVGSYGRLGFELPLATLADPTLPLANLQHLRNLVSQMEGFAPGGGAQWEQSLRIARTLATTTNPQLRDWVFIPTEANSHADGVGVDGIFLNLRSGQVRPIDFKQERRTQPVESTTHLQPFELHMGGLNIHENAENVISAFLRRPESVGININALPDFPGGMLPLREQPATSLPQQIEQMQRYLRAVHDYATRATREGGALPPALYRLGQGAESRLHHLMARNELIQRLPELLRTGTLTELPNGNRQLTLNPPLRITPDIHRRYSDGTPYEITSVTIAPDGSVTATRRNFGGDMRIPAGPGGIEGAPPAVHPPAGSPPGTPVERPGTREVRPRDDAPMTFSVGTLADIYRMHSETPTSGPQRTVIQAARERMQREFPATEHAIFEQALTAGLVPASILPRVADLPATARTELSRILQTELARSTTVGIAEQVGQRQRIITEINRLAEAPRAPAVPVDTGPRADTRVESIGANLRRYSSGGVETDMIRNGGFFYPDWALHPDVMPLNTSPVKVHVATENAAALRRTQEVLIRALETNPELQALVTAYKVIDPARGMEGGDGSFTGQSAKGFTVYTRNAADAQRVAAILDRLLVENGVTLPAPPHTGNVEQTIGTSNRVGVVRDTFVPGGDRVTDIRVDDAVVQAMVARNGGNRLTEQNFRDLETQLGISPGSLFYDTDGSVAMHLNPTAEVQARQRTDILSYLDSHGGASEGGRYPQALMEEAAAHFGLNRRAIRYNSAGELSINTRTGAMEYNGGVYADESAANRSFGFRNGRVAVYDLYRHYGVEPAAVAPAGPQLTDAQRLRLRELRGRDND